MNIIVPINVQTLRVSPSTGQNAKMALYDFSKLGTSPLSGTGAMVAANNFEHVEEALGKRPGIHVHWSIPNAYLHGLQDGKTGALNFPNLPNRWAVVRFFKDLNPSPATDCIKDPKHFSPSIQAWILESDAHAVSQTPGFEHGTDIPWMDDPKNLTGLGYRTAGQKITLNGSWTEPGTSGAPGIEYLGPYFQAPFAYGETFTAYYQHCGNIFGLYDDLGDLFVNPNYCLEQKCNFSVSYAVMGWVSPLSNDTCFAILNDAVRHYNTLPAAGKPIFTDYLQTVFEDQLRWSLSDYSDFTPDNAAQAQGIMSGMASGIQWNIPVSGGITYPSALPDASGVKTAIGNTNVEALSAYLNALEGGNASTDPGDLTQNTEWLLNALQYGQLQNLGTGEVGLGQLDEYLHAKSFGSRQGGFVWTVRNTMTPNSNAAPQPDAEVTLPLPLAKMLSQLNKRQKQYDDLGNEIASRQQKLFFDWCYHINAIEVNVIQNNNNSLSEDLTRDYLLDGLMQLFPRQLRAGASGPIAGPNAPALPYVYNPAVLNIQVPASIDTNLPKYAFNQGENKVALSAINQLIDLFHGLEASLAHKVQDLGKQLETALQLLSAAETGGTNAKQYLDQALAMVQNAFGTTQTLHSAYAKINDPQEGLAAVQQQVMADLTALNKLVDPALGLFAQITVTTSQTVPISAGQVYTGTADSFAASSNMGAWNAGGGFEGMKNLIDQCSGQGSNPYYLSDIQLAGLYLGIAYFWAASGETADCSAPYYVQMAQQEINNAIATENAVNTALQKALAALSSPNLSGIGTALATMAQTTLPGIVQNLASPAPDLAQAANAIQNLLGSEGAGDAPQLPRLSTALASTDWLDFITLIENSWGALLDRLPLAQQVAILSTFLGQTLKNKYEISTKPNDNFWQPNEPVILLTEEGNAGSLIKPVNRNGTAPILPCRRASEIVSASTTFPAPINGLSNALNPNISGLSTVLQQLAQEAFLLCPEIETLVTSTALQTAAQQNAQPHFDQHNRVILNPPPAGLSGQLPYGIAWNWFGGTDPFQPLFIFWEAEYVYPQQTGLEQLPPDYLKSQFGLDQYLVDNQIIPTAAKNFSKNEGAKPNFFNAYGVITLNQTTTANLCDQIRSYCKQNFNYDPASGPPPNNTDPNQQQETTHLYNAYTDFGSMNVLSQALSGFNASMLQRSQEMQLPLNIPDTWLQPSEGIDAFWPTQMLAAQSSGWPDSWTAESINVHALTNSTDTVYFNPLRAGFLKIKAITLVDMFGRFVDIIEDGSETGNDVQPVVAESLQSQVPNPLPDHPIYLPPRIVQPARLLFKWVSADAPDSLGNFTEWNPHPAASPICGWLMPNHLDGSLQLYGSDGVPLGSLRNIDKGLHWFTVPGEAYTAGIDNHQLMLQDLQQKKANPLLQNFLTNFAYPNAAAGDNFDAFLDVIDTAQQFIITPNMQEDKSLAVLIGQPLVLVQATLQLESMGLPADSLDTRTFLTTWNAPDQTFQMDSNGFRPYNFGNFNNGGLPGLQIPTKIGALEYEKNGQTTPYFDDGLVGFFIGNDFSVLYTPVQENDTITIKSTWQPNTNPVVLQPNGEPVVLTLLIDPRAPVHATTGVLPVQTIQLPSDQYSKTLSSLLVTFLTAPVLRSSAPIRIPAPAETGYQWHWQQVGAAADEPLSPSQLNTDAVFAQTPQYLVDGWMKLREG